MVTQEEYENIIGSSQLQQQLNMQNNQVQQQLLMQEQEKGLAEEQLDVEEIIDRIYNLLHGREFKEVGENGKKWVDGKNDIKILSDWGIQRVMQIVRFHINKNTLLSNFREEQISRMMYDFTTELNDIVLLKYQQLFREPTFEECRELIENSLREKQKVKSFAQEILGLKPDQAKIKEDLLRELEGRLEYEIIKIKDRERKNRIKEYGMLLWEIEQAVYSTLYRALGGKERETLRRHAQFTEVRALQPEQMKKGGMFSWLKNS